MLIAKVAHFFGLERTTEIHIHNYIFSILKIAAVVFEVVKMARF